MPLDVLLCVETVSVDEDVAGFGLNDPEVLPGRPETLRLTAELKPFDGVIVTV